MDARTDHFGHPLAAPIPLSATSGAYSRTDVTGRQPAGATSPACPVDGPATGHRAPAPHVTGRPRKGTSHVVPVPGAEVLGRGR